MSSFSDLFIIAKPQIKDLTAILQLDQESGLSSWGILEYEHKLLNPQSILLAAFLQKTNSLVGYLSGHIVADEFELLGLAVRSDFRQQGIGSALLFAGCQELRCRNITRCWLEVRSSNLPAIKLYEKFAYRTVGRRQNYYNSPPEDALLMYRDG